MNTYDPKCGELARYFLGEGASDHEVAELAAAIQRAIEDHLALD